MGVLIAFIAPKGALRHLAGVEDTPSTVSHSFEPCELQTTITTSVAKISHGYNNGTNVKEVINSFFFFYWP